MIFIPSVCNFGIGKPFSQDATSGISHTDVDALQPFFSARRFCSTV